jgi:hypothetical protein
MGGVVVRGQEVDGRAPREHADIRVFAHGLGKAFHDGQAGVILGVKDARHAVPALAGEVPGVRIAVGEGDMVGVDKGFLKDFRTLVAQVAHGAQIVLLPASVQDVTFEDAGVVVAGVEHDAALRQPCVAGEQIVARSDEGHVGPGFGQVECGDGPGDAGPDDEHVGLEAVVVHGDPLSAWGRAP